MVRPAPGPKIIRRGICGLFLRVNRKIEDLDPIAILRGPINPQEFFQYLEEPPVSPALPPSRDCTKRPKLS